MTLIQYCNFYKHTIFVKAKSRKTTVNASLAQLSATEVLEILQKWEKEGIQPVRYIKEGAAQPQVNE